MLYRTTLNFRDDFLCLNGHLIRADIRYVLICKNLILARIYIYSTCYLEVCMVDAIVILHAAHCVVVYCSSMLFMHCM